MKETTEIPTETLRKIIEILKQHAYTQSTIDEIGDDLTKIDDAFAYDHAIIIKMLGGELDE
jgi:hypothetical protein